MMNHFKKCLIVFLLLASLLTVHFPTTAQDAGTCPTLVQLALSATGSLCAATGDNQACYGHETVQAIPYPDVAPLTFDVPGDIADITAIRSLSLAGMDVDASLWGLALLRAHNATFLLFGDVDITSAASPLTTLDAAIAAAENVNARKTPSTDGDIIGSLAGGTALTVNGRSAAGDWLRVELPDSGGAAWVFAALVAVDGPVEGLAVVGADDPVYAPMQAFYLRSGIGDAGCGEAPHSGLLIQASGDAGDVEFLINGVHVRLATTAFIQAAANDALYVTLLEGAAAVEVFGETQPLFAGTQVRVPVDAALAAAAPPLPAEPYAENDVQALPVSLLPRPITVPAPATAEDIQQALADLNACTVTARSEVILREGPGRYYPSVSTLAAGESATSDARAWDREGSPWWRLSNNLWVRGDVVEFTGDCSRVRQTFDLPPTPLPGPNWIDFLVNSCHGTGHIIQAGEKVLFRMGCCGQATAEANDAMTAGDQAWISIDEVMLDVRFTPMPSILRPEGFYSRDVSAWWIATPGPHIVTASWAATGQTACPFTVQ